MAPEIKPLPWSNIQIKRMTKCRLGQLVQARAIVDTGGTGLARGNEAAALDRTYSQAAHARLSGRQIPMRFSNVDLITSALFLLAASGVAQTAAPVAGPAGSSANGANTAPIASPAARTAGANSTFTPSAPS